MSQLSTNKILRVAGIKLQTAWPEFAGRFDVDKPRLLLEPPQAAGLCDEPKRENGGVGRNRWFYTFTLYGRFPLSLVADGSTISAEKDARYNALYAALITQNGELLDEDGALVAYNLMPVSVDRRDYIGDQGRTDFFDLAATFVCQADIPRMG